MLNEYRAELDRIDDAIANLFCARMETIKKIGDYKRENHLDAYDPSREKEMFSRLTAGVPEDRRDAVCALYRAILSISKVQQRFTNTNIVLIGMPGSGKTSVARHLSDLLNRPIASTDEAVEERIGTTIESMFRTQGEAAFRSVETEVVRALSSVWGSIIATGGGTILSDENRAVLRENSRIYYIRRPLCSLDTAGRPLSQGIGALERLYEQRHALYESFSDVQLDGGEDFRVTAQVIANEFRTHFSV
ncbi:MAG: chorismate mutase [Clostridia bacterium]|nr:chorismate mutase [Clostridia bacterium]